MAFGSRPSARKALSHRAPCRCPMTVLCAAGGRTRAGRLALPGVKRRPAVWQFDALQRKECRIRANRPAWSTARAVRPGQEEG
jgi:hypothetical protein